MNKILDILSGWLGRIRAAAREAQLRREIAHLDEHLLKDIGLWDGRR